MVGRRGVVAILVFICSFLILRGEEMRGEDGMGR